MKKLINKIKSWFVREDEADKLFRISLELCEKYGHPTNFLLIEITISDHKNSKPPIKCYNIYTPETNHIGLKEKNNLNLVAEEFELRLKKLHYAKTKEV